MIAAYELAEGPRRKMKWPSSLKSAEKPGPAHQFFEDLQARGYSTLSESMPKSHLQSSSWVTILNQHERCDIAITGISQQLAEEPASSGFRVMYPRPSRRQSRGLH